MFSAAGKLLSYLWSNENEEGHKVDGIIFVYHINSI